jgi:hypothetical protein
MGGDLRAHDASAEHGHLANIQTTHTSLRFLSSTSRALPQAGSRNAHGTAN